jgi:Tol biopolymer transport system component
VKLVVVSAFLVATLAGAGSTPSPAPLLVVSSDYTTWSDDHAFAYLPDGRLQSLARGSSAVASPDGRLVAVLRDTELWTVAADGRGARRIAALDGEPWFGRDPVFSPDGRRVAVPVLRYATPERPATIEIVDLASGRVEAIAATAAGFSPDGASVAFVGAAGLEVANADGAASRVVAPGWLDANGVAWSRDGGWIAFTAYRADGAARVVVVRPDGTGLRELGGLGPGQPSAPAWSSDGRLAWHASPRVETATPAGPVRLLGRVPGSAGVEPAPAWSSDGRTLAVRASHSRIALISSAGGRVRLLHAPGPADVLSSGVSWLGSRLVFSARRQRSDLELELVRADGTGLRALTNNAFADRDPSWAPDGKTIAFVREGASRHGVYSIGVSGGAVRRLTEGDDSAPAFAPDAPHLAFVRGTSIRLLDLRTGRSSRLATTRIRPRQLSWTPDGSSIVFGDEYGLRRLDVATRAVRDVDVGGDAFRPVVSPDGHRIAFLGYRDERYFRDLQAWGIFVSGLDGSGVRKIASTGKFGPRSWSPDQRLLAASDGARLMLVDTATGSARPVLVGGWTDGAAFAPPLTR